MVKNISANGKWHATLLFENSDDTVLCSDHKYDSAL
jgi:hypothetical protein